MFGDGWEGDMLNNSWVLVGLILMPFPEFGSLGGEQIKRMGMEV